jgi:outer membrane protein
MRSLFGFFVLISLHLNAQDSLKTLSLEQCVNTGITNSTNAIKGQNAIDLTGTQILSAYGQFLPDVQALAGYTYTGGTNLLTVTLPTLVNSQRSNLNYQVVSTINIFTGFANQSALKAALLNKEGAEFSLARAKQQIELDITQSYLQIVLDKQILDFATLNYQTSQKREDQLKELVAVGRRTPSDLYQQQSLTSLDQQFLTNAINKLRNDKILLLQKLRIDASEEYQFTDIVIDESPLAPDDTNDQKLIEKALSQRADLKYYQRSEDAALLYVRRARSGYLPRVYLSAGAYGVAAEYSKLIVNGINAIPPEQRSIKTQLGDQIYGVVGLNMGWTFDKFATKSGVAAARINASNARLDRDNVTIQIIAEIKQAVGNYQTALQQVETSKSGLAAARQAYETLNGRYALGSANFIELSNAQNNLLLASQNRAQASINLMLQKKALDYYVGF